EKRSRAAGIGALGKHFSLPLVKGPVQILLPQIRGTISSGESLWECCYCVQDAFCPRGPGRSRTDWAILCPIPDVLTTFCPGLAKSLVRHPDARTSATADSIHTDSASNLNENRSNMAAA